MFRVFILNNHCLAQPLSSVFIPLYITTVLLLVVMLVTKKTRILSSTISVLLLITVAYLNTYNLYSTSSLYKIYLNFLHEYSKIFEFLTLLHANFETVESILGDSRSQRASK